MGFNSHLSDEEYLAFKEEHIADGLEFHHVKIKDFIENCLENFVRTGFVTIGDSYVRITFGTVINENGYPRYVPRNILIYGKYYDEAVNKTEEVQKIMKAESEAVKKAWYDFGNVKYTGIHALINNIKKEQRRQK